MGLRGSEGRRRLMGPVRGRRAARRNGAETETGGREAEGYGGEMGRRSSASPAESTSSVSTTVSVTTPDPPGDDEPSATDWSAEVRDAGSSVTPSWGILERNSRAGGKWPSMSLVVSAVSPDWTLSSKPYMPSVTVSDSVARIGSTEPSGRMMAD